MALSAVCKYRSFVLNIEELSEIAGQDSPAESIRQDEPANGGEGLRSRDGDVFAGVNQGGDVAPPPERYKANFSQALPSWTFGSPGQLAAQGDPRGLASPRGAAPHRGY